MGYRYAVDTVIEYRHTVFKGDDYKGFTTLAQSRLCAIARIGRNPKSFAWVYRYSAKHNDWFGKEKIFFDPDWGVFVSENKKHRRIISPKTGKLLAHV